MAFKSRCAGPITYVFIAFVLAWAIELGPVRAAGLVPGRAPVMLLLMGVMFVPSLAALASRAVERSGFGDAGLRWGPARYYLIAWLLPFAVSAVAVGITLLLGLGRFDPLLREPLRLLPADQRAAAEAIAARMGSWLPVLMIVGALTQGVIITTIFAFGEEFGWRGYLLPRLGNLGPLGGSAAAGTIWGLWHAPVIAQGHNYPGHPVAGVFFMIAFCVVWGIILGWLFLASRSVLAPSIAHASLNSPAVSLGAFVSGTHPLLGNITGVVGIAVAGCVALWLWRSGRMDPAVLNAPTGVERQPSGKHL